MKRMEDAKKRYDEIPIPAELHARVQQEIAKADARRAAEMGQKRSVQRQATVIGVGQKWSTPVTDSVRSQTASIEVEQLGRAGDANENLHVGNAGIESLDDHVQRKATVEEKILDISRKRSGWKRWTAAAAGLAVLFTLGLNTNQAFAQGMEQVPVLGVVENMSYSKCPDCGKEIKVFGESHVQEIAARYHLPVLAQCPIDPELAKQADLGVIESFETDHLDKAADVVEALLKEK